MATGVEALDNQHKDLIERLRGLSDAIREGETKAELLELFGFLETYVREHFAEEEIEFERLRCPEAELNRKGHQRFLQSFQALKAMLQSEGPSEGLAQEIHHELGEWFVHHILLVDTRLFILARSEALSA